MTETTTKAVTRDVRRRATEPEIADAGRRIAGALHAEKDALDEKRSAMEGFKERLERIRAEIDTHRLAIEDGEIVEQVECAITMDPNEARVVVARLDNGEIIEERAMTAEELAAHRQLSLAPPPDNIETFAKWRDPCGCVRMGEGAAIVEACADHAD